VLFLDERFGATRRNIHDNITTWVRNRIKAYEEHISCFRDIQGFFKQIEARLGPIEKIKGKKEWKPPKRNPNMMFQKSRRRKKQSGKHKGAAVTKRGR
jgi:hypothetical protein